CGNRQHRNMVAVTVEKTVDKVQVSRSAGTCTDGEFARELRFGTRGKGGDLFMAGGHPFNGLHPVAAVAESVQRIAGDAPDTLYASLLQGFRYVCSHGLFHGGPSPLCDIAYKLRRKSLYWLPGIPYAQAVGTT